MGSEYKRRTKEMHGQNAVRGYDVVVAGVAVVSGVAAHSSAAGPFGLTQWTAPRAGLIDYVVADVSPTLASGALNISVAHGGTVVASGALVSSLERIHCTELSNELTVVSGEVLQIAYAVPTVIGAVGNPIATSFEVRVGLRYKER